MRCFAFMTLLLLLACDGGDVRKKDERARSPKKKQSKKKRAEAEQSKAEEREKKRLAAEATKEKTRRENELAQLKEMLDQLEGDDAESEKLRKQIEELDKGNSKVKPRPATKKEPACKPGDPLCSSL